MHSDTDEFYYVLNCYHFYGFLILIYSLCVPLCSYGVSSVFLLWDRNLTGLQEADFCPGYITARREAGEMARQCWSRGVELGSQHPRLELTITCDSSSRGIFGMLLVPELTCTWSTLHPHIQIHTI